VGLAPTLSPSFLLAQAIFDPNFFPYKIPKHFANLVILHTSPPMKMEQTECSEMSAYKTQTPGNYPEESIKHFINFWNQMCILYWKCILMFTMVLLIAVNHKPWDCTVFCFVVIYKNGWDMCVILKINKKLRNSTESCSRTGVTFCSGQNCTWQVEKWTYFNKSQ